MHAQALTKEATALFQKLSRFEGFYLVGGTALALQIGHRLSVDLDLFSTTPLESNLLQKIKRIWEGAALQVTYRAPEQINLIVNNVKVTFFNYPYAPVLQFASLYDFPIVSVPEIAAMKAFAIGKRLSYKDYVDWYFMLHEQQVTLPQVIEIAKKKYGGEFNDRLFLGQLVSFGDVATQKIDFLRGPVEREEIEQFLTSTVANFPL